MAKSKASKKATIALVIAVITAAAFITGILTDWFTNFKKYLPTRSGEPITANADELYAPDTGLLISQTTSNGIMLYSAATPLADFATYSLDENVEAVKTITARFTPADTTLQEVDYTAAWKNSASSWAKDKDVNDYITLTQSADGSLDCAVSLSDAIGEQIIITCTARPLEEGDWTPSATCTVDYYKRAIGVNAYFYGWHYEYSEVDEDDYEVRDYYFNLSVDTTISFANAPSDYSSFYCSLNYSSGTISNKTTCKVYLKLADDMISTVQGITGTVPARIEIEKPLWKTHLTTIFGSSAVSNSNKAKQLYNAFLPKYNANESTFLIEVEVTDTVTKVVKTFSYPIIFNPLALGVKAQGLELDTPGIIF